MSSFCINDRGQLRGDGDRGVLPLDTAPAPPEVSEPTVQLLQITKRRRKGRRMKKWMRRVCFNYKHSF